jgi:hypothetical protein
LVPGMAELSQELYFLLDGTEGAAHRGRVSQCVYPRWKSRLLVGHDDGHRVQTVVPVQCTWSLRDTSDTRNFGQRWDKVVKHCCIDGQTSPHYQPPLVRSGTAWRWLRAFLCNRRMRVVFRSATSAWFPLRAGTPQGAIVSPFMFAVYVKPISDVRRQCFLQFFADDLKVSAADLHQRPPSHAR